MNTAVKWPIGLPSSAPAAGGDLFWMPKIQMPVPARYGPWVPRVLPVVARWVPVLAAAYTLYQFVEWLEEITEANPYYIGNATYHLACSPSVDGSLPTSWQQYGPPNCATGYLESVTDYNNHHGVHGPFAYGGGFAYETSYIVNLQFPFGTIAVGSLKDYYRWEDVPEDGPALTAEDVQRENNTSYVAHMAALSPEPVQGSWVYSLIPALQPVSSPIGDPEPMPLGISRALPRVSVFDDNADYPQHMYGPGSDFGLAPNQLPSVDLPLELPGVLATPPQVKTGGLPGVDGRAVPVAGTHVLEPPGRGKRERKHRVSRKVYQAMGVYGEYTEAVDVIDAAWWALPDSVRKRVNRGGDTWVRKNGKWISQASTLQKVEAIYRNYRQLDMPGFVKNLVMNQIIDYVGGLGGKASKAISQKLGLPWGLQFGSAAIKYAQERKRMNAERAKRGLPPL